MKTKIIYTVLLFVSAGLLSLSIPPTQGPHGGMLKPAEGYFIEMKNVPDTSFFAYLLTKKLKTVSSKGISGEVKLFFPDSTALDVQLSPAPGNGFTGKMPPGFYGCKVTFHVLGKDVSATFEKQTQTAQKK